MNTVIINHTELRTLYDLELLVKYQEVDYVINSNNGKFITLEEAYSLLSSQNEFKIGDRFDTPHGVLEIKGVNKEAGCYDVNYNLGDSIPIMVLEINVAHGSWTLIHEPDTIPCPHCDGDGLVFDDNNEPDLCGECLGEREIEG